MVCAAINSPGAAREKIRPFFAPAGRGAFLLALALATLCAAGCRKDDSTGETSGAGGEVRWTLTGKITPPEGAPAEGVFVYAEGTSFIAVTNSEGGWTLTGVPPGAYRLRTLRPDLLPGDYGEVELPGEPLTPGAPPVKSLVTLTLQARETPAPAAAAAAQTGALRGVIRLSGDSSDFRGVMVEVARSEIRTVTDTYGEYFFPALPPGPVELVFSRPGWVTAQARAEIVAGKEMPGPIVELRPAEDAPPAGRSLFGRVVIAAADPATPPDFTRVTVSLEGTTFVATPDTNGAFAFPNLPPAPYFVVAAAPGYALRERVPVNLTDLEAAEVTLALDPDPEAARKFGTVGGRALYEEPDIEEDHSGILVSLVGTDYVAVTDFDGRYEISNVPPGSYTLRAQAEGFLPQFIAPVAVEAERRTELDTVELPLFIEPPRVLFTDPADGARDVAVERDTSILVRFSKNMQPGSVKSAFSISPPVAAKLYMGREHPRADYDLLYVELKGASGAAGESLLAFATTYKITISAGAQDFEGAALMEPYTFSFTTGEPQIIASRPEQGETAAGVFPDQPIVIYFNAPMEHASFRAEDVRIRPEPSSPPRIQLYDNQETGWTELRIYATLQAGEDYTVNLRGAWRTRDRARVANLPWRLRFQTAEMRPYQPYKGKSNP